VQELSEELSCGGSIGCYALRSVRGCKALRDGG